MAPIARRCRHILRFGRRRAHGSTGYPVTIGARGGKIAVLSHQTCRVSACASFPPARENLMLSMPVGFEGPSVSGNLTRRQLLHAGGLSMLGLGLPGALRANDSGLPAR